MRPSTRCALFLGALLALLLGAPRAAAATPPAIAVQLIPDTPEIDATALRDAVARELDATVLDRSDSASAPFTVFVGVDHAHNEIVVERRGATSRVTRRVPLPADPREALRITVFLIGNLARDEASEVLRDLDSSRRAPPRPAPASTPALPRQEPAAHPMFWFGVSGEYDLVFLHSAQDVCLLSQAATPLNGAGYYCADANGNDVPSRAANAESEDQNIIPGSSDQVAGGLTPGNARALISFDYAPTANILVGARVGYVFNTYTGQAAKLEGKAFPPLHAETRATYVFGHEPLWTSGLAPYAMVAAGVAQWSAEVPVTLVLRDYTQGQATSAQAWELSGPAFVSVGAGLRWALTPRVALLVGPRFNVAFGVATLASISQELGMQFGF